MRRIILVCLTGCLLLHLTACHLEHVSPEQVLGSMENVVSGLGSTQITKDHQLSGRRILGEDAYVGTYQAHCSGITHRDVIFGGASIQDRSLKVSGDIVTASGSATIRIRLGEEVTELSCDENGHFEVNLSLCGGGNYIMAEYQNFTGEVNMVSEYISGGAPQTYG